MSPRSVRKTHLITYSKADLKKFPSRETFALAVTDSFKIGTSNIAVVQWVCCREKHKTSDAMHYHPALKLSAIKRWKGVKDKLRDDYGIEVLFSDKHDSYYSAYKYVTKEDTEFIKSENHPDLCEVGSPPTKKCLSACRVKRKSQNDEGKRSSSGAGSSKKRLSNLDIAELITERGFRDADQLGALAEQQRKEGKKDLAQYLMNRSSKRLDEIFESAWKMSEAEVNIKRRDRLRIDVIREASTKACGGEWLRCVMEILRNNSIHSVVFAHTLRELILKGRGKNRNIMLIGPTNCGKTFLFTTVQSLFDCFSNPSNDKYAWVGIEKAECIFLNDFRFNPELISWKEFLSLLEGQLVHLPAPKNHFAKDICLERDTPVFATGKDRIKFIGRYNYVDEKETGMMDSRWHYIEMTHQIPKENQKNILPCCSCFSKLVLTG